jgi:hypothetical protein
LAALTAGGAGLTFFLPSVLAGPAAMQGSARGTALVLLAAAVPALVVSAELAARGSRRAALVALGAVLFVMYNSVLLLFSTPFNPLFLLYVAMLSCSLMTVAAFVRAVPPDQLAGQFDEATPVRGIAAYIAVVTALNTLLWLRGVVPALWRTGDPAFLRGTGLTTNPVYVQDLAVWLPLAALTAWWLWHRQGWGFLLGSATLTLWVLEAVCVGTDQWFGSQADPASPVASSAIVVPFYALAVIGCVPLVLLLRHLRPRAT